MDSSEPEANVGKMWIVVTSGGRIGRFRLAVCVDVMVLLFGRITWTPIGSFLMFKRGMSQWR